MSNCARSQSLNRTRLTALIFEFLAMGSRASWQEQPVICRVETHIAGVAEFIVVIESCSQLLQLVVDACAIVQPSPVNAQPFPSNTSRRTSS